MKNYKIMKKMFLIFCTILGLSSITKAQILEKSLSLKKGTFDINATKEKGKYNIEVLSSDDNQKKVSYSLSPFSQKVLEISLLKHLQSFSKEDTLKLTKEDSLLIKQQSKEIFFRIISNTLTENPNDAPLAGKIFFNDSVEVYKYNEKTNKFKWGMFFPKDIEIEFNEGYIAQFKVIGDLKKENFKYIEIVIFDARYPIGFSGKRNFSTLNLRQLYNSSNNIYIDLDKLIKYYDYSVQFQTRDLSPENQVLRTPPGKEINLYKSTTSKLFEARIYSDFLGLDNKNPNGLVQFELKKRININTYSHGTNKSFNKISQSFGFSQFVNPFIRLSKLEENNKFLPLKEIKENLFKTHPINLLYFQNLNLGIEYNIFYLTNPNLKYEFEINGNFGYASTSAQIDTFRINKTIDLPQFNINYLTFGPELSLRILPEERFNFNLKFSPKYIQKANNLIIIESIENIKPGGIANTNYKTTNWVNQFEMEAIAKTGENGRLFARWKFNYQNKNINENFHQIQLGYSFYLLKQNK